MLLPYTYPLGLFKNALGWSWYRDVNPVPASPLANNLATAPSELVIRIIAYRWFSDETLLSRLCHTDIYPVLCEQQINDQGKVKEICHIVLA